MKTYTQAIVVLLEEAAKAAKEGRTGTASALAASATLLEERMAPPPVLDQAFIAFRNALMRQN